MTNNPVTVEAALTALAAKTEAPTNELQKAHDGWQNEVSIIRDIAAENLERAEKAEAEIARLTAERDQALARAAAAAMEMRDRAAKVCDDDGVSTTSDAEGRMIAVWLSDAASEIRALPIDTDAHKALDKMLAQAREDAIREAASACDWGDIHGDNAVTVILSLLNDGGQDDDSTSLAGALPEPPEAPQ